MRKPPTTPPAIAPVFSFSGRARDEMEAVGIPLDVELAVTDGLVGPLVAVD